MADALNRPTPVERAMRVRKAHDVGVAGGGRRPRTDRAAAKVVGASPRPSGVHAVDLFASGHLRSAPLRPRPGARRTSAIDLLARTVGPCARRGRRHRPSDPERIVTFEGGGA